MNRKQNSLMRFSRTERLAQLSEQEIVIERKKREIQAKIEAQKKKEAEEALKRLESSKESKYNKSGCIKKSSSGTGNQKNNVGKPVETVKESLTNAFSNDGSFLDQFKKLSKSGLSSNSGDMQTLAKAREEFRKYQGSDTKYLENQISENKRNEAYRDAEKSRKEDTLITDSNCLSSQGQPFDSKAQLQLQPSMVHLFPQQQGVSVMQSVNSPKSLAASNSVFQSQTTQNQLYALGRNNLQLNSFSSNHSGIPKPVPEIQVPGTCSDFKSKNHNKSETSESSQNLLSATSLVSVQTAFPIPPQNIPFSSLTQVQNTQSLKAQKDSELPKHRTESISLSLKPSTTKRLEAIPNPLEVDQPPSPKKSSFSFSEKKEILNSSQNYPSASISESVPSDDREHLRISSAFYDQEEDVDHLNEKCRHWAQLIARYGDEFEDSLRNHHQEDPNLRFLFQKDSKEYMFFRKLVSKLQQHHDFSEHGFTESTQKKLYDEVSREKLLSGKVEKTKFPKTRIGDSDNCDVEALETPEKLVPTESEDAKKYCKQADNEDDHYNKISDIKSTEYQSPSLQEQSYPKEIPEDNSKEVEMEISDKGKFEERRKRKRKSRWGDVATTSTLPLPGKINVQPTGKLPVPKSTLLSQLTRSDPGLIQYARQTFGSTNLSEEDWKKAEDHYKINLLYQDMVKKRAEIEKLERQGKFKYEYDSDEDTEGGTWEHKLRQQEMQATQLWAEELTRQAAGKHHIGDFLPPEELERFMEKYNAVKEGREPDLSDYKEYKLKQDNVGYRLLQKMGWNEGQGLGQDGSGIQNPVNKATTRHENQGLGVDRPDGLEAGDDEYDAYRKRMMLAYRFRPNPLNNPRRPYY